MDAPWDADNRLVRGMSYGTSDRTGWRRVDWAYDALGRRIRQTSYVMRNGVWVVREDLKSVSDPVLFGRHVVELNATNHGLLRSYVWGLGLSETLDGAGEVGGLLWVRLASSPASETHFATYDGNGNVWQLISASSGTETARYDTAPSPSLSARPARRPRRTRSGFRPSGRTTQRPRRFATTASMTPSPADGSAGIPSTRWVEATCTSSYATVAWTGWRWTIGGRELQLPFPQAYEVKRSWLPQPACLRGSACNPPGSADDPRDCDECGLCG